MQRVPLIPVVALCLAAGALLPGCREERVPAGPRGAVIAVPEPSAPALLGAGLGGVIGYRLWQGRKAKRKRDAR